MTRATLMRTAAGSRQVLFWVVDGVVVVGLGLGLGRKIQCPFVFQTVVACQIIIEKLVVILEQNSFLLPQISFLLPHLTFLYVA